jgi:O-antigen/teichoic acid export membrane protein
MTPVMTSMDDDQTRDVQNPDSALFSASTNVAQSSVFVALASLLGTAFTGLIAVLVTVINGERPSTDGFLAAYAAYTVFILFSSTLRSVLVSQFGPTTDPRAYVRSAHDNISRIVPVAAVLCAVIVVASPLLGNVLMSNGTAEARRAAKLSIAPLGLAAFFQIWAAVLAAVLTGARRFVGTSLFFVIGSATSLITGGLLLLVAGIAGAAIGLLLGALTMASLHLGYLARLHFVAWPRARAVGEKESWISTGRAAAAAVLPIVLQLNLTISLGLVAATTGLVTAYTFGYLATVVLIGAIASTIALVTMPSLIVSLHRDDNDNGRSYLGETAAFGTFLFLPIALSYALFGHQVVESVLGSVLSDPIREFFWNTSRIFLVMGLFWALFTPVITLAMSQKRYVLLARTALFIFVLHIALVIPLSHVGAIDVVVGHATSGALAMLILLTAMFHSQSPRLVWEIFRSAAPSFMLGVVFVIVAVAFPQPQTLVAALGVSILSTAIYVVAGIIFWPAVAGRMARMLFAKSSAQGGNA